MSLRSTQAVVGSRPTTSLRHTPAEIDDVARELLTRAGLTIPSAVETSVEVRSVGEDGAVTFGGYAVKWDQPTVIRDWWSDYIEVFRRGSWTKTIAERGAKSAGGNGAIKLMYKHDAATMGYGGAAVAGAIDVLEEDEIGVRYEAHTIDTSTGRDLAAELRAGVIDRVSFGFDAIRDAITAGANGALDIVERLEIRAYEISPVNWPAYETSTIDYARNALVEGSFVDAIKKTIAEVRAGRVLSQANVDRITEARDLLNTVLDTATTPADEPSSDTRSTDVAEDAPPAVSGHDAIAVRARALSISAEL